MTHLRLVTSSPRNLQLKDVAYRFRTDAENEQVKRVVKALHALEISWAQEEQR